MWNAILDYSSGKRYVWTGEAAEARADPGDSPVMPTITEEEFRAVRHDFFEDIKKRGEITQETASQIDEWVEKNLPTAALPPKLRRKWNTVLKQLVRERLTGWFDKQASLGRGTEPNVVVRETRTTRVWPDTEQLRRAILECVRHMSRRELLEIRLPASALLSYGASIENPTGRPRSSEPSPDGTLRLTAGTSVRNPQSE